jgi:hypothetical protein
MFGTLLDGYYSSIACEGKELSVHFLVPDAESCHIVFKFVLRYPIYYLCIVFQSEPIQISGATLIIQPRQGAMFHS